MELCEVGFTKFEFLPPPLKVFACVFKNFLFLLFSSSGLSTSSPSLSLKYVSFFKLPFRII